MNRPRLEVLPQTLKTAFATGEFNRVPIINGTNRDEWRLFVALSELAGNPVTAGGAVASLADGSTETCPIVTTLPAGSPGEMALTAGKPVLYHRVRIVDAAGRDAAAGEPGEIWIRGRSVMQGYWENAQATREAFRDGWFRNGDLGLLDEEGYLHIVDRIKDIIIVGSSNVYPSDLETVLGDCADICEAAVVGRHDGTLNRIRVLSGPSPPRSSGPDGAAPATAAFA
jgi:acyl-CoA synthetase (AMP-forming)/AMP-acid ligase II